MSPKTPLRRPYEYFEDKLHPLASGVFVFLGHLLVDLVSFGLIFWLFLSQIENAPASFTNALGELLFGFLIMSVIIYVLAWLIVGAIMHLLSGGEGSYTDALGVAGWAYAPEIITAPVSMVIAWRYVQGLDLDWENQAQFRAEIEAIESASHDPLAVLIVFVVVLWSVYILAKGTAATHEVPVSKTVLPAVLVGVGSLALTILGMA